MITKVNKKTIIIAVLVVLLMVIGFVVYKYNFLNMPKTQDEQQDVKLDGIDVGATSESAFLMVCVDKCGDNVCQETLPACAEGDMNCICQESKQECPQDCK